MTDARPSGRLTWRLEGGTAPVLLDVRERLLTPVVDVFVDGQRVTELRKPTRDRPWITADIAVLGAGTHSLALFRTPTGMATDVFKDGASLLDGRSIEVVRAEAPTPMDLYARTTDIAITGVSRNHLFPRWVVAWASAGVLALAAAVLLRSGIVAAVLLLFSMVTGSLLFLRTWLVATAKAHAKLLHDTRSSDTRLALLAAVFLAFPLGLLVGLFSLIALSELT